MTKHLHLGWLLLLGVVLVACPEHPPSAPNNLVATPLEGAISLEWQDNSDNEDRFYLYRAEVTELGSQPDLEQIATVRRNTTSYVDNTVVVGTLYTYGVAASGKAGSSNITHQTGEAVSPKKKNNPPIAEPLSVNTAQGSPVSFTLRASDPDDDPLSYEVTKTPNHGTLTGDAPNLTYTPQSAYHGYDSFSFVANDGKDDSNEIKADINIAQLKDIPIAVDDVFEVAEDATLEISASGGVLANDKDPEDDPLSAKLERNVEHGTLTLNEDGSLIYEPKANFAGLDSFSYIASDGTNTSNAAEVTLRVISVNDAPVAVDDSAITEINTSVDIDILANDQDESLNPTSVAITKVPEHGEVKVNLQSGVVTYTPAGGYSGSDSFQYTVDDTDGASSDTATVSIVVTAKGLGPSLTKVEGYKLMVQRRLPDGTLEKANPFLMRGVVWSPASEDTNTSPADPNNVDVRRKEFFLWDDTDIRLIKEMNANTVRLLLDPGLDKEGIQLLDKLYDAGLMVIMTVDKGINDREYAKKVVSFYKEHPAILGWSIGSEWSINKFFGNTSLEEAVHEAEKTASSLQNLDPNHIVISSYGDVISNGISLEATRRIINDTAPSFDVWSLNVYRGKTFGSLFEQWRTISDKPMFLGEFGTDAFASSSNDNPPIGAVDEGSQAAWVLSLWRDLWDELSARDDSKVAVGGVVFSMSDEWWKIAPPQGSATVQDAGGFRMPFAHPDGFSNEEYYGIVDIHRNKRTLYTDLQEAFSSEYDPEASVIDFAALPERLKTNVPHFPVAGATRSSNQVTVNRIDVPLDRFGTYATFVPLSRGDNRIELVIRTSEGIVSTFASTITYDPNLSTANKRLLYVDTVAERLPGTLVLDIDAQVPLGYLKDWHIRGISPDGKHLYGADRSVLRSSSHQVQSTLGFSEEIPYNGFAVGPDGRKLYSGNEVLDLSTNQVSPLPVSIQTGIFGDPAISKDGKTVFCCQRVQQINTEDLSITSTGIQVSRYFSDLALTPNEEFLLASRYASIVGTLDVYDATTYEYKNGVRMGDYAGEIEFSSDGKKIVIGVSGNDFYGRGGVMVYDLATLEELDHIGGHYAARGVVVTNRDEVFTSSGPFPRNGAGVPGIDAYTLQADGKLDYTHSFHLGVSDSIRRLVYKP